MERVTINKDMSYGQLAGIYQHSYPFPNRNTIELINSCVSDCNMTPEAKAIQDNGYLVAVFHIIKIKSNVSNN